MRTLHGFDWLFLGLLVVGGINWGLVGLLNFDLVAALFGPATFLTNIVYVVVGISAVYIISSLALKNQGTHSMT